MPDIDSMGKEGYNRIECLIKYELWEDVLC